MNEGDWTCCDPQCGNVNFARRTSCNRCGTSMSSTEKVSLPQRKKLGHEIGKAAAEKSRGLFSADDWQCGRCGNVNWARRQQCNMCNAPKFGEVEERTGLGGGYNERENVEYIERDESDGEYDDFGRKKKKFRGNEDSPTKTEPKNEAAPSDKTPKLNADEDDEEDDDDGDLSKYDLSGWGDDDDDNSPKDKEEKRLRSSSSHSSGSRSSSYSSRSSKSPSSSDSEKRDSKKRTHSRSRSSSAENSPKRKRSRSPDHISGNRSRLRERSESSSPSSSKR